MGGESGARRQADGATRTRRGRCQRSVPGGPSLPVVAPGGRRRSRRASDGRQAKEAIPLTRTRQARWRGASRGGPPAQSTGDEFPVQRGVSGRASTRPGPGRGREADPRAADAEGAMRGNFVGEFGVAHLLPFIERVGSKGGPRCSRLATAARGPAPSGGRARNVTEKETRLERGAGEKGTEERGSATIRARRRPAASRRAARRLALARRS